MIESFVDLTYRGLSLGRRIKLTQVRPSSGTLELATPMPVGTQVAIATDDGVMFEATVSWVNEQIAGTDRTPGMVVVPALAADPAAAWWKARVALPDEDKPKPRPSRNRPVTVRPRSHTQPGSPPAEAIRDEIPMVITDPGIDDSSKTLIMAQFDPSTFGADPGADGDAGASDHPDGPDGPDGLDPGADGDAGASDDPAGPEPGDPGADGNAGASGNPDGPAGPAGPDGSNGPEPGESDEPAPGDKPAAGRSFKKRRKRR